MSDGPICTTCGNFAMYCIELDLVSKRFYQCQTCHDEFIASFDKLPKDRTEAVLKELTIRRLDK